jgi:hypothetical protein
MLNTSFASDLNATIDKFFSDSVTHRFEAQRDFYNDFRADQAALEALVDEALAHIHSVPGIYDVLSILNRIPPGEITDQQLREKIVRLTENAATNSLDTERLAMKVRTDLNAQAAIVKAVVVKFSAADHHVTCCLLEQANQKQVFSG